MLRNKHVRFCALLISALETTQLNECKHQIHYAHLVSAYVELWPVSKAVKEPNSRMERSPAQGAYSRKFVFNTAVPFVAVRMAFLRPWIGRPEAEGQLSGMSSSVPANHIDSSNCDVATTPKK